MENEKIEILKIVLNITEGNPDKSAGIPSIDRRILLVFPQVVYERKLKDTITTLVDQKYLSWTSKNMSAVRITRKGIQQIT